MIFVVFGNYKMPEGGVEEVVVVWWRLTYGASAVWCLNIEQKVEQEKRAH